MNEDAELLLGKKHNNFLKKLSISPTHKVFDMQNLVYCICHSHNRFSTACVKEEQQCSLMHIIFMLCMSMHTS